MTGKELRRIRQKLGLTQTEFAERLRISRVSVNRMEYGNQVITPSMALLIELVAERESRVEPAHGERGGRATAGKGAHRGKARDSDRKSGGRSRS